MIDQEKIALGSALSNVGSAKVVLKKITEDMLADRRHKKIFKAIVALEGDMRKIDVITTQEQLKRSGDLEAAGGVKYILDVASTFTKNIDELCNIIRERWVGNNAQLALTDALGKLTESADPVDTINVLQQKLSKLLEGVSQSAMTGEQLVEHVNNLIIKRRERGGEMSGIAFTGTEIDQLCNGREPGDLIVFAARPKQGKSSIMNNILKHSVENGIPTYAKSGEMNNFKSGTRLIAAMTGIPTNDIKDGKYLDNEDQLIKYQEAYDAIYDAPIVLDDGALNLDEVKQTIQYYYYVKGIELFCFDRIGLFHEVVVAHKDHVARNTISSELRRLANELQITIVLFSQMTSAVEQTEHKRPSLVHVYGATALQSNATKLLAVYRPEAYNMDTMGAGPWKGYPAKDSAEVFVLAGNDISLESRLLRFEKLIQLFKDEEKEDLPSITDLTPEEQEFLIETDDDEFEF